MAAMSTPPLKPRLIMLDLDGTLLRRDGTVSARTWDALCALEGAGAAWGVATGRGVGRTIGVAAILPVPTAGWVCAHGAATLAGDRTRRLASVQMSAETVTQTLETLRGDYADAVCAADHDTTLWIEPGYPPPRDRLLGVREVAPQRLSEEPADMLRVHAKGIHALAGDSSLPGVRVYDIGRLDYVEIAAAQTSKPLAIGALATDMGIKLAQTWAVGDGPQDEAMILAAGWGVAMPDSCPQTLAAADAIAPADCDHDGVARILQTLQTQSPQSAR